MSPHCWCPGVTCLSHSFSSYKTQRSPTPPSPGWWSHFPRAVTQQPQRSHCSLSWVRQAFASDGHQDHHERSTAQSQPCSPKSWTSFSHSPKGTTVMALTGQVDSEVAANGPALYGCCLRHLQVAALLREHHSRWEGAVPSHTTDGTRAGPLLFVDPKQVLTGYSHSVGFSV